MARSPIEKAEALQASGDFLGAAGIYAKLLKKAPELADVLAMIADDALGCGDEKSATLLARKVLNVKRAPLPALIKAAHILERGRAYEDAATLHRHRTKLAPADADAWRDLGATLNKAGDFEDAETATRRAIDLAPGDPIAHAHLAAILRERGEMDEALAAVDRALEIAPGLPPHRVLRAELLLAKGDFENGWRDYESRLKIPEVFAPAREIQLPDWKGEPLNGGLLIIGEQGFGDVLQFCRYATLAAERAGRAVLVVHPPLVDLTRSLAGVEVGAFDAPVPGPFAAKVSLLSLPLVLGGGWKIPSRTPYLSPSPAALAKWPRTIAPGPGLRVGLCWRGNPEGEHDRGRSMSRSDLAPLAAVPGVQFHSLQRDAASEELAAWPGLPFVDLGGGFQSFDDTAAAIMGLDLVISTDTALAHVAGAIGKPCWLLLKKSPAWRWGLAGEATPWYPGMRLYRQTNTGDWRSVVETVHAALMQWAS
ncbi:MAG: tetratricopeptide repeat-containing glycosyltransferase family protein [Proteobacteria bacterium]|nr:tetratricopeptide repeat-containing glycosyltransferase family protein [Pseudomonadota bacterium]